MNPYQITGVMAVCITVFAGVVTLLALQGMPVLLAFLTVYLVALCTMFGMQRRARQCIDDDLENVDRPRGRSAFDGIDPAVPAVGASPSSAAPVRVARPRVVY